MFIYLYSVQYTRTAKVFTFRLGEHAYGYVSAIFVPVLFFVLVQIELFAINVCYRFPKENKRNWYFFQCY